MIEVSNLSVGYNGAPVLSDVTLSLDPGTVLTVVGSNGAGKTTLLRAISGLLTPKQGSIRFEGREISNLAPARIVDLGVAHVPEGRRIFPGLTVRENLRIGAYRVQDRAIIEQNYEKVYSLFPILHRRQRQIGTTLSGGEQQMLAIGRAMMSSPKVMLLDEPTMGLAPLIIESLYNSFRALLESGISIFLVEQNAAFALRLASQVVLLRLGRIVASGPRHEIEKDQMILQTYLGVD